MLDWSFLVEAGAGSGKTAVMAGRVAMLLAAGVAARSIAAVTFTELPLANCCCGCEFVEALVDGRVPPAMAVALSHGLSAQHKAHLTVAAATIDQLTCSTIHGFCQRLIMQHLVEANIDPGASIMDRDHAQQVIDELGDAWLWSELDGAGDSLLTHLVTANPTDSIALVRGTLGQMRNQRALSMAVAQPVEPLVASFVQCGAALEEFVATCAVREEETALRAGCFVQMAQQVTRIAGLANPARLAQLQALRAHPDLCSKTGFSAFNVKGKWKDAAKLAGLRAVDGEALFDTARQHVLACQAVWTRLTQEVAATVLAQLVTMVRPLALLFSQYKRSAALLDFHDLLHAARDLLRDHDDVRAALGQRYRHVLVGEFQDTDPPQSDIFWRLCGDAGAGVTAAD